MIYLGINSGIIKKNVSSPICCNWSVVERGKGGKYKYGKKEMEDRKRGKERGSRGIKVMEGEELGMERRRNGVP